MILSNSPALPDTDPRTQRVKAVSKRLTDALEKDDYALLDNFPPSSSPDLDSPVSEYEQSNEFKIAMNREWYFQVIDDLSIKTAQMTGEGWIIVYTGLLGECQDDNALALVLAHEMAHHLARHIGEIESTIFLPPLKKYCEFGVQVPSFVRSWWRINGTSRIRRIEKEADEMGLQLMSRACYDPEKALALLPSEYNICSRLDNCTPHKVQLGQEGGEVRRINRPYGDRNVDAIADPYSHWGMPRLRTDLLAERLPEAMHIRSEARCPDSTVVQAFNSAAKSPST